jgi:hypothetical protein
MSELADGIGQIASWYAYALRQEALETWRALPGPWYVRLALVAVCLAIPGFLDELALVALVKFARARRAKRMKEGISSGHQAPRLGCNGVD